MADHTAKLISMHLNIFLTALRCEMETSIYDAPCWPRTTQVQALLTSGSIKP
jgi:hypothetical protein